jgi:hypothetical protein
MNLTRLRTDIREGAYDSYLDTLQAAIRRRRRQIRDQRLYRPKIGDKVVLRDWYPHTTEGRIGTVLYSNRDMAIVTFVTDDQQFIDCHVPLANCTPAPAEVPIVLE